jgi:hypothetical protein
VRWLSRFEIPRRPGRYELRSSTNSVLGMGLGELTLTAVQREEDGTPLPTRQPLIVSLHADQGELTPEFLTIPAGAACPTGPAQPKSLGS